MSLAVSEKKPTTSSEATFATNRPGSCRFRALQIPSVGHNKPATTANARSAECLSDLKNVRSLISLTLASEFEQLMLEFSPVSRSLRRSILCLPDLERMFLALVNVRCSAAISKHLQECLIEFEDDN
jgi:hypothetical protein